MIVPRDRLLWVFGLTLVPASVFAAAVPGAAGAAWAVFALLTGIGLLDALDVERRSRGLSVEFPREVNVARACGEELTFWVSDKAGMLRTVWIGPELPAEVSSPKRALGLALPPGGEKLKVDWPIRALERGEYPVKICYFRIPSRLGLWFRQGTINAQTRIRVHPDLKKDYRMLASAFMRRDAPGLRSVRQVGKGREFEKLREYLAGDSQADIHWKASARRSRLVTKEYQIERTQEVYVAIDASRLSARALGTVASEKGDLKDTLLERYVSAALTFGDLTQRWGDKFGLVTFERRISGFIRAGLGRAHFRSCLEALFSLRPKRVTPDFDELAGFFLQTLRRRAMILFLTSLDDPALAESFTRSMAPVGRRHVVVVSMVRPELAGPIFSNPVLSEPDDIYRCLGGHLLWQNLRELEVVLGRSGIGFSLLDHEKLCVEMVSQYLSVKRRQIL